MKKFETQQLLALLSAAYNNFDATNENKTTLWHSLLGDIEFNIAKIAVQKLILESSYPPTIHDIRQRALEVIIPEELRLTPAEAWGEVKRNISRYGSYRAQEGISALPLLVRETVQYIGYIEICRSENPDTVRAQFMRMYEQVLNRRQNDYLLPEPLKEQIRLVSNNMKMLEG